MRRTYLAIAALVLLAALAVAGCGGGSSSTSTASAGEPEPESAVASRSTGETKPVAAAAGGKAAVVKVTKTPKLGKVIVDAQGMTLYDFHKDKGTTSACYGACAAAWPPLLTHGKPKAAGGAEASLLGVTERKDGTEQVTYAGHPVYLFVADKKRGDTNGNDIDDFGAEWYALQPDGNEPEDG